MARRARWLCSWLVALAAASLAWSCDDDDPDYWCRGDTCVCERGSNCDIPCHTGTCSAECAGDNDRCRAECANGSCGCGPDSNCSFRCVAPPCLIDCAPGASCSASCANGVCTCAEGGRCSFTCDSGPCHVTCEGNHEACEGECSNGQCTCGPNSSCTFRCLSGPCHTSCASGSDCVVECPPGTAGTQNCDIVACSHGAPVVCPGGVAVACGAPCPAT